MSEKLYGLFFLSCKGTHAGLRPAVGRGCRFSLQACSYLSSRGWSGSIPYCAHRPRPFRLVFPTLP